MNRLLLFVIIIKTVYICYGYDITGFHEYSVGDTFVYYTYECEFNPNNIGEYEMKSTRRHQVDSILIKGDTVEYHISFKDDMTKISYTDGLQADTTYYEGRGSNNPIVVKDSLVTPSDFFPIQKAFTEDELTKYHEVGTLQYAGLERDYLKYDYFSSGPGGAYDGNFYSYLAGFGTICRCDEISYVMGQEKRARQIQLVKYNDIEINPSTLAILMIGPMHTSPAASVNNSYHINSLNDLYIMSPTGNCKGNYIRLFALNGRMITTVKNTSQLKLLMREVPSGVYIISGQLNNMQFRFFVSPLK